MAAASEFNQEEYRIRHEELKIRHDEFVENRKTWRIIGSTIIIAVIIASGLYGLYHIIQANLQWNYFITTMISIGLLLAVSIILVTLMTMDRHIDLGEARFSLAFLIILGLIVGLLITLWVQGATAADVASKTLLPLALAVVGFYFGEQGRKEAIDKRIEAEKGRAAEFREKKHLAIETEYNINDLKRRYDKAIEQAEFFEGLSKILAEGTDEQKKKAMKLVQEIKIKH